MNIKQQSLSNFFEINVNSAKLTGLLEKVIDTVDNQQHRIKSIIERFNNNAQEVNNKFRNLQNFYNDRIAIVIQTINEEKHKNKLIADQLQRQNRKHFETVQKQIKIVKQQITSLGFKHTNNQTQINTLKGQIYGDFHKNCQNDQQNEGQREPAVEFKVQTQEQLARKKPLKDQIQEIRSYLKLSETKTNDELKNISRTIKFLQDQQFEDDKLGQQLSLLKKNFKSSKKKKKIEDSTIQFAIFANRLDKIQDVIRQERQRPQNRIVYPRTPGKKTGIRSPNRLCTTVQGQSGFSNHTQIDRSHQKLFNAQFINMRLLKIDERMKILQEMMRKQIDFLKNRSIVTEEKVGFLSRKIDKYHLENNQIQNNIRVIRESQLDDKALEIIKNQMKKMMKDSDNALGIKVDRDQFIKQKLKVYEKITLTNQSIIDKADKEEVKKALMFFQDKIKQIILLIADQQNNQKTGALSRVPFKCLSCDKNLQLDEFPKRITDNSIKKNEKGIKSLRIMTEKIKKRIKMNIPATITQPDSD